MLTKYHPDGLFYNRMSALFDLDHITVIHLRLDIAVLFADLRKEVSTSRDAMALEVFWI